MRRLVTVVALVGVVATGCTSGGVKVLPPPKTIAAPTTEPPVPDYSGVDLKGSPGRTTTTSIPLTPGQATVRGLVTGPDGQPVPGATVRIERLVGDAAGAATIATGPDGNFAGAGLLGGRFRVRAWRTPDLAVVQPAIFFLAFDEQKPLDFRLERFTGVTVLSSLAPNPPVVDSPVNLAAQVVTQSVDNEGVVRSVPVPGARVQVFGDPAWVVNTANPTTSDANGRAGWELECRSEGAHPLSVTAGQEQPAPVTVQPCAAAPPQPPPTTAPASTTTTSAPRPPPSSTTSTTRRQR